MSSFHPVAPEHAAPQPELDRPSIDAIGPNMGHFLVLFVIAAVLIFGVQIGALLLVVHVIRPDGHHSLRFYAELLSTDARFLIPTEALAYGLVIAAAVPVFREWWGRRFAAGIHWNLAAAMRRFVWLVLTGLACGLGIGLLGSLLPMPKNPPITADMMHSPLGAWMMLLFGVTGAPLFEEMFFRGFLLPAFLNTFRWLSHKGDLSPQAARWLGIPVSIALTSAPFALLHAQQVSHAWAPVLLIGVVSMVLCIVRMALNSLAASTLVHAAYNFTLFAGLLVETSGFRHLDKLVN